MKAKQVKNKYEITIIFDTQQKKIDSCHILPKIANQGTSRAESTQLPTQPLQTVSIEIESTLPTTALAQRLEKILPLINYLKNRTAQDHQNKKDGRTFDKFDGEFENLTDVEDAFKNLPDTTALCTQTNIEYLCKIRDQFAEDINFVKQITDGIINDTTGLNEDEKSSIKKRLEESYLFKLGNKAFETAPEINSGLLALWQRTISQNSSDGKMKSAEQIYKESLDHYKKELTECTSGITEPKEHLAILVGLVDGTHRKSPAYRALPPEQATKLLSGTIDFDQLPKLPNHPPKIKFNNICTKETAKNTSKLEKNEWQLIHQKTSVKDQKIWVLQYKDEWGSTQNVSLNNVNYWRFGKICDALNKIEQEVRNNPLPDTNISISDQIFQKVQQNKALKQEFRTIIQQQVNQEFDALANLAKGPTPIQFARLGGWQSNYDNFQDISSALLTKQGAPNNNQSNYMLVREKGFLGLKNNWTLCYLDEGGQFTQKSINEFPDLKKTIAGRNLAEVSEDPKVKQAMREVARTLHIEEPKTLGQHLDKVKVGELQAVPAADHKNTNVQAPDPGPSQTPSPSPGSQFK